MQACLMRIQREPGQTTLTLHGVQHNALLQCLCPNKKKIWSVECTADHFQYKNSASILTSYVYMTESCNRLHKAKLWQMAFLPTVICKFRPDFCGVL